MSEPRRDELKQSLAVVRERIEAACRAAGRDPAEVTLIVITKKFPAEDVLTLHEFGVRDFGENRDQEAGDKIEQVRESLSRGGAEPARFHFVGQLQTNKASRVSQYADVVQTVDRAKLATVLGRAAVAANRTLDVLVQISLDGDTARGGVPVPDAAALAGTVAATEGLQLRGVMAVAPLGADPDESFAALREVAGGIRQMHPEATWISAGMSSDLEAAVRNGATHLRVGSAILGSRPSLL